MVCPASLVMQIGDPRDGFFYPILTLMMDSYNLDPLVLLLCWYHRQYIITALHGSDVGRILVSIVRVRVG